MKQFQGYLASPGWIQVLLSTIFFGVGLALFYFMGQVQTLKCQRVELGVDCTITTTWLKLSHLKDSPVPKLNSASLDESCDNDGCTYRVVLSSRYGDFPLSGFYTSDQSGQQEVADRINTFIRDASQSTLTLEYGLDWFLIIPVIFMGVGLSFTVTSLINHFSSASIT